MSYVDIKIIVFNEDLVTLSIQRNTTAMEIYNLLAQVGAVAFMYRYLIFFFFLFIVTEYKRMQKNMGFFRQKITQTLILATRYSCIFLLKEISLRPENMKFFALFEIFDQNFERKIQPNEFPHSLYMSNYSTAAPSCIR